jgi:hypothetical protein
MIRQFFVALMCLAATACVSTYQEAATSAATATLQFEKGYTTGAGFGTGTMQEYSIIDAASEPRRAAFFTWTNGEPITRRVPAGEVLRLHANTTYTYVTGVSSTGIGYYANTSNNQCNDDATFTPQAGHTYVVTHAELSYARCNLRIVDATTGVAPPDLSLSGDGAPKPAEQ